MGMTYGKESTAPKGLRKSTEPKDNSPPLDLRDRRVTEILGLKFASPEYIIVSKNTLSGLEKTVRIKIKAGWKPLGGIAVHHEHDANEAAAYDKKKDEITISARTVSFQGMGK